VILGENENFPAQNQSVVPGRAADRCIASLSNAFLPNFIPVNGNW
jgi:hypothetical protein